jgi:uncharacterized protein YjbI with pentapeptide repeats
VAEARQFDKGDMNPEHLRLIQQSFGAIDEWHARHPGEALDLSGANLSRADMSGAQFGYVDFSLADLSWAKLQRAHLDRAEFIRANMTDAQLAGATLRTANLTRADLRGANLRGADLAGAVLSNTNLSEADLSDANLEDTDLSGTILSQARVSGASFKQARCRRTIFSDIDLSEAKYLETVQHLSLSTLGLDTLQRSLGNIPERFLRGCGVHDQFIASLRGRYRPGQQVACWRLLEILGKGGNGEVWKASDLRAISDDSHALYALKILRSRDPRSDAYARFRSEVSVLRTLERWNGILPLLDAHLPDVPSSENPAWLAMPVAIDVRTALKNGEESLERTVSAVAAFAETLTELHAAEITHRDVKPDNLFWHDHQWAIGDFGLVDYPRKESITKAGRKLGPTYYLPHEMLNHPDLADGRAADVYSLAKTLWVLATGQNFPPQGEQRRDVPQLGIEALLNEPRASPLDLLIEEATRHDPGLRPSMREFASGLRHWLTGAV